MLVVLSSAGCVGQEFLTEQAAYEVQVKDESGRFVEGVRLRAIPLQSDRPPVEERTDSRGRCLLMTRQDLFWFPQTSTDRLVGWLKVTLEAEGFESRTFDFRRDDFVDDGGMLRRVEAVTLKRTSK